MSEAFKWNLSPTERRMAETAFAASNGSTTDRLMDAVRAVRRLRDDESFLGTDGWDRVCDAMLAELRSEPASPCDEHDYRIQRLVEGSKQMRFLLESLIACDNVSASVAAIEAIIVGARKELAR